MPRALPFALALAALLGAAAFAAVPKKRPEDHVRGKELWERSCWPCHGRGNAGDGPAAAALPGGVPDLQGKMGQERFDELVGVILKGRGAMPAYAAELDEHNARRILVYLNRLDAEQSWPSNTPPAPEDEPPPKDDDAPPDEEDVR